MGKRYDKSPSKPFNCRLSLNSMSQIDALINHHGYATQRSVIETAVELLFGSVSGSGIQHKADEAHELRYEPTYE